jgi:hypothetical protein
VRLLDRCVSSPGDLILEIFKTALEEFGGEVAEWVARPRVVRVPKIWVLSEDRPIFASKEVFYSLTTISRN